MKTKTSSAESSAQRGVPSFLDARNAKPLPDGSPNILRFGHGLDLWVRRADLKVWRCKVQRDGKQTTINLGYFPAMTIAEAREARAAMKNASDPARERRQARQNETIAEARTFRSVAERWITTVAISESWSERHRRGVGARLARHVYPVLGDRPVAAITTEDVQDLIRDVHAKAPKTAVMVKQHTSGVLGYAWANDWAVCNVVEKIKKFLPKRKPGMDASHAFVRTIEDARLVLAAVEARRKDCSPWTLLVHRLIALTAVRKEEALGARWSEFDLDAAKWTVPAVRMKGRQGHKAPHVVALSPQAIEVIRAANRIRKSDLVFPVSGRQGYRHRKDGKINASTLNAAMPIALRLAGLPERMIVPHGWRGTFSTIMNEVDPTSFRIVDAMLAHKSFRSEVDGEAKAASVESRYNHAEYRSARHRIACRWADMLLDGAPSALALIGLEDRPATNVVELRRVG